ncbi:MAG: hypothetical protein U5O44_02420 [Sphaerotilus sp.]|nr:hypothetical protein [Sphaerotilus sp.]
MDVILGKTDVQKLETAEPIEDTVLLMALPTLDQNPMVFPFQIELM